MNEKCKKIDSINNEISRLKYTLYCSDYKVIKSAECTSLNIECEYDISVLHTERQAIRDQINQLEQEITNIEEDCIE